MPPASCGPSTNVKVGDHVVLSCGMWDESAPDIQAGQDPIQSTSSRIWGYENNYGSFAQFTRVDSYQCFPKAVPTAEEHSRRPPTHWEVRSARSITPNWTQID